MCVRFGIYIQHCVTFDSITFWLFLRVSKWRPFKHFKKIINFLNKGRTEIVQSRINTKSYFFVLVVPLFGYRNGNSSKYFEIYIQNCLTFGGTTFFSSLAVSKWLPFKHLKNPNFLNMNRTDIIQSILESTSKTVCVSKWRLLQHLKNNNFLNVTVELLRVPLFWLSLNSFKMAALNKKS